MRFDVDRILRAAAAGQKIAVVTDGKKLRIHLAKFALARKGRYDFANGKIEFLKSSGMIHMLSAATPVEKLKGLELHAVAVEEGVSLPQELQEVLMTRIQPEVTCAASPA